MKRRVLPFFIFFCTAAVLQNAVAGYLPLRTNVIGDRPEVRIVSRTADQIVAEFRLPGLQRSTVALDGKTWDRVAIPGGAVMLDYGKPEVPCFTRLVAIPAESGVQVEFRALEVETVSDVDLMPSQEDEPEILIKEGKPIRYDAQAYLVDDFYPQMGASAGEPALMRGLRLVTLDMRPVQYNPVAKTLKVAHRFQVTINFTGTDRRNVPSRPLRPVSRSWLKLWENTVINLDDVDLDVVETGSYLIVCEDDDYLVNTLLQPLVDWKRRKGHTVVVETFTPGASNSTIKQIIQSAYDNWEIPPEYVLLWGDTSGDYALPAWYSAGAQIDHPYSQLEGGDILADVALGRCPADDDYQTVVMVNKILFYEKMPYTADSDWFHQAVLVAGSENGWWEPAGMSHVMANRSIKTRLIEHEYTWIDTFWYGWPGMSGSVESHFDNAINDGVTYVNYRGYIGVDNFSVNDINDLTNSFKLPFVTIITCGTGGFGGSESYMERFANVGTPTNPTGAVAAVGTATSYTHSRFNNTVDVGIYQGILTEGITQAGNALNRGKLELYNAYHSFDPGAVTDFSEWNALAGDPGLELFTGPIRFMESSPPGTVSYGENTLSLTVTETGGGPLEGAIVCLFKEGELQEVGLTDAAGTVTLPLNPETPGNVKVTVTKQGFYPIVDSLDVVQADVVVGYLDHDIDDDENGSSSGDDDGYINPGEQVEIPLVFENYGSGTTATGISVTGTLDDDYATLVDDYETFPDLSPGESANSFDDFDIQVANDCPHGHVLPIALSVNSDQGNWEGLFELTVISYDMVIRAAYAQGEDSLLSPGETADFVVEIANGGGKSAASLTAVITSLSPYITVNDNSAGFGTVNVGSVADCSGDPFNLSADADAPPGYPAQLTITFTSASGAVQTDTVEIFLGERTTSDPQGPDEYGYWCFDDTDFAYPVAPTYNWVEINPGSGGPGTQLPIDDTGEDDDMSVTVNLPFTFQYYGQQTDAIAVCSNGWISITPDPAYTNFANYPIPSSMGPEGLIAPFWDDLITGSGGYVYAWSDEVNHRFIVQWDNMRNRGNTGVRETFEVILYDPAHYPTPTGDGDILFQYQSITEVVGLYYDNHYSTVGIERPDHQDGIEVVYWNTYDDPAAAHLQNNRAYLFTTNFDYIPPGAPQIDITLTYVSGSPVPPGGGNINFDVYVANVGTTPADFDAWVDIEYEGGPPTTVILRGFTAYLPGWTINRPNMFFPIPGSYAAGNYEFTGRVGIHPDEVWNESGFPFVKSGDDADPGFVPFVPDGVPDVFDQITKSAEATLPAKFALLGCYPNPFNPVTVIRFDLPQAAKVTLDVFDVNGRLVSSGSGAPNGAQATRTTQYLPSGTHEITFDGSGLSSGVYIYRLKAGEFTASGKMVLLK